MAFPAAVSDDLPRRTDGRPYDYACHDDNDSFGGITRGARVFEHEAVARSAGHDE